MVAITPPAAVIPRPIVFQFRWRRSLSKTYLLSWHGVFAPTPVFFQQFPVRPVLILLVFIVLCPVPSPPASQDDGEARDPPTHERQNRRCRHFSGNVHCYRPLPTCYRPH